MFKSFLDSSASNALSSVIFASHGGNYTAGAGVDVIYDFLVGSDTIDLSGIDADSTRSGNQAFELVEDFTGHAGEVRLVDVNHRPVGGRPPLFSTSVLADIDGDGEYDFELTVVTPILARFDYRGRPCALTEPRRPATFRQCLPSKAKRKSYARAEPYWF